MSRRARWAFRLLAILGAVAFVGFAAVGEVPAMLGSAFGALTCSWIGFEL